jgi:flagellin
MLTVNTNLAALTAQSAQQTNARSTATVMQQLSTSKRINNAVDDVAGLAISTRMMSQIKGAMLAPPPQNRSHR